MQWAEGAVRLRGYTLMRLQSACSRCLFDWVYLNVIIYIFGLNNWGLLCYYLGLCVSYVLCFSCLCDFLFKFIILLCLVECMVERCINVKCNGLTWHYLLILTLYHSRITDKDSHSCRNIWRLVKDLNQTNYSPNVKKEKQSEGSSIRVVFKNLYKCIQFWFTPFWILRLAL